MTDGPHKSLPMKRPWRKVAEYAWNPAFGPEQVAEAIPRALLNECNRDVAELVRAAMEPHDQGALFEETPQQKAMRVERIRSKLPGSPFADKLIDATVREIYHPRDGTAAFDHALTGALQAISLGAYRGIEEHCLRKRCAQTAESVRNRLLTADREVNYTHLASELMKPRNERRSTRGSKRSGLDEGVSLP